MKTKAFDVQPLIRDGQQGRLTPPKDARGLSVMLRAGGAVWQWKTKNASGWTTLSHGRTNGPNRIDLRRRADLRDRYPRQSRAPLYLPSC